MIIKITPTIQETIRSMRKQKGIRGDDLSKMVGKSPSYISRIENGKTRTIEEGLLFAIFKNLMEKEDSEIQEYIDLFIEKIPESNDFDTQLNALSESKQNLLRRFLPCLTDENNSYQFLSYVLQAINLSNKPVNLKETDDDNIDLFVITLAATMQAWKRRKAQEREELQRLRESIPEYDELF